jgi:hypothetical protein
MRRILLTGLLFLCLACLSAQSLPKSFVSLSIGSSNPAGNYAGANNFNTQAFARPGTVVAFDWAKYYSHFGITATISFANHKLDQAAVANTLIN